MGRWQWNTLSSSCSIRTAMELVEGEERNKLICVCSGSHRVSASLTLTASNVCVACVTVCALLWSSDAVSAGSPAENSVKHTFFFLNVRPGSCVSLHPFFSPQHRQASIKVFSSLKVYAPGTILKHRPAPTPVAFSVRLNKEKSRNLDVLALRHPVIFPDCMHLPLAQIRPSCSPGVPDDSYGCVW